jgi:hypothetical protein
MPDADKPSVPSTEVVRDIPPSITTSTLQPGKFRVVTTGPDEILGHWITDDQLEMLKTSNRDGLSEAMWAFIGGALVGLPPAIETIWEAYIITPSVALSGLHLIEVIMVMGCACTAATIAIVSGLRSERATTLVDQIRARQRV